MGAGGRQSVALRGSPASPQPESVPKCRKCGFRAEVNHRMMAFGRLSFCDFHKRYGSCFAGWRTNFCVLLITPRLKQWHVAAATPAINGGPGRFPTTSRTIISRRRWLAGERPAPVSPASNSPRKSISDRFPGAYSE